MLKIKSTDFRAQIKHYFELVEKGELVRIIRNGKPVADIIPVQSDKKIQSWKTPGVKIKLKNISITQEILNDREKAV